MLIAGISSSQNCQSVNSYQRSSNCLFCVRWKKKNPMLVHSPGESDTDRAAQHYFSYWVTRGVFQPITGQGKGMGKMAVLVAMPWGRDGACKGELVVCICLAVEFNTLSSESFNLLDD